MRKILYTYLPIRFLRVCTFALFTANSFGASGVGGQAQELLTAAPEQRSPPADDQSSPASTTISYPYVARPSVTQEPVAPTTGSKPVAVSPPSQQEAPPAPTAVEDITGKSKNWWDYIFDKGSPLHFELDLSETYDDNILIQPQKISDFITNISPSVLLELGDKTAPNANYLSAIVRPTFLIYADHSQQDATDYFADVQYQHQFTRLTLGLEQIAAKLTTTNIDVGNRVQSDVYSTIGTASYDYNNDLSLAGSLTQTITDYEDSSYIDTTERIADFYALYKVLPKLSLGLGPRIGMVDVQGGPNQVYEDGLVHLIYQATGKITVTVVGGGEVREYTGNNPDTVTPVYEVRIDGQPTDSTTLSLDSNRHRIVSYGTTNQDYVSTDIEGDVRQRFVQDFYGTLGAGYALNDYVASQDGTPNANRSDSYYFVRAGAEWKPRDWLDLSAVYQYSEDDSNFQAFTFTDNQITLRATLLY